jgi:hypothetical protein
MKHSFILSLKLSGIILGCALIVTSCGPAREEIEAREKSVADSIAVTGAVVNETAAQKKEIAFKADSGRVFVRSADLNFKVKDVKLATFDIERIVRDNRGYVTSTALESTVKYKNAIRVSRDSIKETVHYDVQTNMTIRVPNTELDKTLSEIAVLFDYLDHRRVYSQDITKELQLASLSQANFKNHKQRVEKVIEEKGKKLNSTIEAENSLFEKQAMANQTSVDTKELNYDVAYSTVSIAIYQNESVKSDMLAYSEPVKPYEPPFSGKLADAASTGGTILVEILLFFVRVWPLWLVGIGAWFLAKRIAKLKWFN